MPAFPTFLNGVVSQLPYTEQDDFTNVEDWIDSGFATSFALNPSAPQKVFTVNAPCITESEVATFETFFKQMGQVGTFTFPADDGTLYAKCRFDSPKYTVTYLGPNEYSLSVPIRSLGGSSTVYPPGTGPSSATSALLTITTSFARTTGPGIAHVGVNGASVVNSATAYGTTSTTHTLSPTEISNLPNLTASFYVDNPIGTVDSTAAPSTLSIYDCYLDVTYPDTSTARLRPVSWSLDNQGASGFGALSNPANAMDADAATAATLTRTSYDSLDFYNTFTLSFS